MDFEEVIEYLKRLCVPEHIINQIMEYKPFPPNYKQQKRWIEENKKVAV